MRESLAVAAPRLPLCGGSLRSLGWPSSWGRGEGGKKSPDPPARFVSVVPDVTYTFIAFLCSLLSASYSWCRLARAFACIRIHTSANQLTVTILRRDRKSYEGPSEQTDEHMFFFVHHVFSMAQQPMRIDFWYSCSANNIHHHMLHSEVRIENAFSEGSIS